MSKNIILLIGIVIIVVFVIISLVGRNKSAPTTEDRESARDVGDKKMMQFNADGNYSADIDKSSVAWTGRGPGKAHSGEIAVKSGLMVFKDGVLTGGEIVLDMNAITSTDLPGETGQKLVAHLQSTDFFSVSDFPEAKLEFKNSNEENGVYVIMADLTIKDVTKEITFDAEVSEKSGVVAVASQFDIDRTEWGVTFGSKKVVDKISDNIVDDIISFDVQLVGTQALEDVAKKDMDDDVNISDDWRGVALADVRTGKSFTIDDFAGKHVLIESFAVWCPTCLKQQNELKNSKTSADDNVVHIGLNTDPNENAAKVRDYITKNGFDWYYGVAPIEMTRQLTDEFGLSVVNAPQAPIIHICPDGSAELLKRGLKKAVEIDEYVGSRCGS